MGYDDYLEERINRSLKEKGISFNTKRMMGGLCYLVDDKMLVGIIKKQLMVRLDPEIYEEALQIKGAGEMDFTGRALKGYIFVEEEGYDMDQDLEKWLTFALEFNPRAKKSRKKSMKTPD
jgi:TfoX/Sxy family transcriptional regulator of competence genes